MNPKHLSRYSPKAIAALKKQVRKLHPKAIINHLHPVAYCIAKPSAHCAVFAVPKSDFEIHLQVAANRSPKFFPPTVVVQNESAALVEMGDWCATAYVYAKTIGGSRVIAFLK